MSIIVKFSHLDRMIVSYVGLERNFAAADKGFRLEEGREDLAIEAHIIGAMGEYAVARAFNLNYHPVAGEPDTKRGDVGKLQVKTIRDRSRSMIVREHDPVEFDYVLCFVPSVQEVEIVGWLPGSEVKTDRFWKTKAKVPGLHRDCFMAKAFELRNIHTLKIQR